MTSKTWLSALALVSCVGLSPSPDGAVGLFGVTAAQADDDDGGDGDDDDGGGGRVYRDDDDDGAQPVRRRPVRRAAPAAAAVARAPIEPPAPPEFVVSVPDDAALETIAGLGFTIVARDRIDLIGANIARLQPPIGVTLEAARAQILAAVAQSVVDLNTLYRPEELLCGPEDCAAFAMIGWQGGGTCRLEPTIGMIDTGVNAQHPSLTEGRVEAIPVLGEGRRPASQIHGTAVALLIAGGAASRTPGTLPSARLIAAEAFHKTGAGEETADVFDVVRGIELLVDRDVDVVNMSFSGGANLLLERAIDALAERNVPVVAAAGNAGPRSEPLYPAAYPRAIAVTAVDARNNVYRQANAGEHIAFAAPGVRLWTAASVSGGRYRSGTSYAAPFVTSALAIKRASEPEAKLPSLIEQLAAMAVDLGEPGRDATFGHGLLKMPECGGSAGAEVLPVSTGAAPAGILQVQPTAGPAADGDAALSPTDASDPAR